MTVPSAVPDVVRTFVLPLCRLENYDYDQPIRRPSPGPRKAPGRRQGSRGTPRKGGHAAAGNSSRGAGPVPGNVHRSSGGGAGGRSSSGAGAWRPGGRLPPSPPEKAGRATATGELTLKQHTLPYSNRCLPSKLPPRITVSCPDKQAHTSSCLSIACAGAHSHQLDLGYEVERHTGIPYPSGNHYLNRPQQQSPAAAAAAGSPVNGGGRRAGSNPPGSPLDDLLRHVNALLRDFNDRYPSPAK